MSSKPRGGAWLSTDLVAPLWRSSTIWWLKAMGWLFGCFGAGGRRERLPRLCSGGSGHHSGRNRGRHSQSKNKLGPSTALLHDASPPKHQFARNNGLNRIIIEGQHGLKPRSDETKAVHRRVEQPYESVIRDEVRHLRSCGISLSTPEEIRLGSQLRLDVSLSPIKQLQIGSDTRSPNAVRERAKASTPIIHEGSNRASDSPGLQVWNDGRSTPEAFPKRLSPVLSISPNVHTPTQIELAPSDLIRAPSPSTPESPSSSTPEKRETQGEETNLQQVEAPTEKKLPPNLPKLVPSAGGFFMFPRKRSLGYKSLVWQEPLSPVAEAENSMSSEEEEKGARRLSAVEAHGETSSAYSEGSRISDARLSDARFSPRVIEDSTSPSTKSSDNGADLSPVQCASPPVSQKAEPAVHSPVGKENRLNVAPLASAKRQERRPDDQHSVLTPVGNLMQWKQIKDKALEFRLKCEPAADEVYGDSPGEPEVDDSFFKEVLQGSAQMTPQASTPAIGLQSASPAPVWDVPGIPNTTSKYREDQQVSWHSTPFEVRLDKALAKQIKDVQHRDLFRC